MIMPIIVRTIEPLNVLTFEYKSRLNLIYFNFFEIINDEVISFLNLHFERIKVIY